LTLQQTDAVLVLTTIPLDLDPDAFSGSLLAEHLAACVSVFPPMLSTYRWQGKVESASERQVVIKTTRPRLEALERRLAELHPYELPELIVLTVSGGGTSYLAWLAEEAGNGEVE
jgi:periplasmic divalent cation tolerance protein